MGEGLPPSAPPPAPNSPAQLRGDGRLAGAASAQSLLPDGAHERALLRRAQGGRGSVWWFGGGMDLTPYYGFEEDAATSTPPAAPRCALRGDRRTMRSYKAGATEYFFLKHRNEPRGVGGIFFDDLNGDGFDFASCFA
jgi:coproporphyrinogen III oxidase